MSKVVTEETTLYDGQVSLSFYPNSHRYKVDGKWVPNVTTLLDILSKGDFFQEWLVREIVNEFNAVVPIGVPLTEIDRGQIAQLLRAASVRKRNEAAEVGIRFHALLEEYIKRTSLLSNDSTVKMESQQTERQATLARAKAPIEISWLFQFYQWEDAHDIQWLESEKKIYSRTHRYVGTLDAIALIDGNLSIVDFKTTKNIFAKYFYQTAAYGYAYWEEKGTGPFSLSRFILQFHPLSGDMIVHGDLEAISPLQEDFHKFLLLKEIKESVSTIESGIRSKAKEGLKIDEQEDKTKETVDETTEGGS